MVSENNSYLHKILSGAAISFILGGFGYVLVFLSKLFAARYFGASDFGDFSLVETIVGFLILLGGLGFSGSIAYHVSYYFHSRKFDLLNGFVSFVISNAFFISLFFGFLLFIFSDFISSFFNVGLNLSFYLKLVAISIPLRTLSDIFSSIFTARNKYIYAAISYHLIEKLVFLFGVLFIFLFNLNFYWLFIFYTLSICSSFIFNLIVYLKLFFRKIKAPKLFRKKEWFFYSLPLLFSGLFAFVISWTDNLTIGIFLTSQELGIYSIAYSLASFLLFFQVSFATLFLPVISEDFAKNKGRNISILFRRSSFWIFSSTFPFFLIFVFLGNRVLGILYGSEFITGFSALIILSVGFLINISSGLGNFILMVFKDTKKIFYINASIALFNLILNLLFVPIWGLEGAAISSALSVSIQNILFYFLARSRINLSFAWKSNLKFMAVSLISLFLGWLIYYLNLNFLTFIILFVLTFFSALIILSYLFKIFSKEDLDLFEKFIGQIRLIKFLKKFL